MKAINNFENVKATTGEFAKPTAGGYCIEILSVEDVPLDSNTGKGDYLKIEYDICHGEFMGYYTKQHERWGGEWYASFIRSYKDSAAGMFKHFINCIESSNIGYKWDWKEQGLKGKFVGVVLGEEEYQKKDGSIGTKLVVKDIKTLEQILNGEFKVPAIKKLDSSQIQTKTEPSFVPIDNDEELPFN